MSLNEDKGDFMKQFTDYIKNKLDSVYCYNCKGNDDDVEPDFCDDCHRKYMNWEISDYTANQIAEKAFEIILSIIGEENEKT